MKNVIHMHLVVQLVWMDEKWILCEYMLCIHCLVRSLYHLGMVIMSIAMIGRLGRIILVMIGANCDFFSLSFTQSYSIYNKGMV